MGENIENPMVRQVKQRKPLGVGFCVDCGMKIFEDEEILITEDGELLCDETCLKSYLGVKSIEGREVRYWK